MGQNKYTHAKALFDRYGGCFAAMYSDGEIDRFRAFGVPDDIVHGWKTEQRDRAWSAFLASGEGEKAAAFDEYIRCAELLCDEESLRTAQDWLAQNDAGLDRISAARMAKAVYRLALSVDAHRNMKKELHKGGNTMRKLTIKRQKSFVACLGKMKVYIEDAHSSELEIDGISYRKLGTLANGQEVTFEIGNNAARICVIADKMSRNYCNEIYPLPEGEEDISLSGKNHYNPATGNPFYFDGVTDAAVLANRKSKSIKFALIFVVAIAIGVIVGLARAGLFESNDPKTFVYEDFQITLTEAFDKDNLEGYDVCYLSDDVAVFVIRESVFAEEGGNAMTLQEYAEAFAEYNDIELSTMKNGMHGFMFVEDVDGEPCHYYGFFHEGDGEVWTVQFAVFASDNAKYEQQIYDWADTIKIAE